MLQVQELVDSILDFLHDSRADLKRCALVCKSWLPPAQYHLFSYYVLQNERDCQWLFNTLHEASHVRSLITHIAISLEGWGNNDNYYKGLEAVQSELTNLRKLSVYRFPFDIVGLAVVQQLCAISSITHIFMLCDDDPVRLCSPLLNRTANLGTLELGRRTRSHSRSTPGPIVLPSPQCMVDCLDIKCYDDELPASVVSLFGMLDLSSLQRLTVHDCGFANRLNQVLRYCTSVSSLDIHGAIGETASFGKLLHIGPPTLFRLSHFTFHVLAPSALIEVPLLLAQFSPESSLRQLTLVTTRDCAPPYLHESLWADVDAAVARLPLVSLIVKVSLAFGGVIESDAGVTSLRRYLPSLAANSRLRVTTTTRLY
ncbi:hypothetical protein MSAN_01386400 [Mycena sanguinolenta]|uniref:F-box domain-containing protein n=1 Tax=Mycena sanguinolenta TaxID=230812 RepID=A0A8H6YAD0_9AGAR|nr:hypothetical protein MSAN_01386400 [Mycena sanguinolenta]